MKQSTHRYASLDCIRGLAAFIVLTTHMFDMDKPTPDQIFKPLMWLFTIATSGIQAVMSFFVLSGFALFILSESLVQSRSPTLNFLGARWVRLFPVYIFSILFSIAVHWTLRQAHFTWEQVSLENLKHGFLITGREFNTSRFLQHALMIGRFDTDAYNHPIWSIVHEMRISMAFPLIYYAVKKLRIYSLPISQFISIGIGVFYIYVDPQEGPSFFNGYVVTAFFGMFFVWGAVIALYRVRVLEFVKRLPKVALFTIFVLAFVLYIDPLVPVKTLGHFLLHFVVVAVGSCGIIMVALALPGIAEVWIFRWLGKISYSLYLMHYTCLSLLYITLHDRVPFYVLCILSVVLSLLVSEVVWRLVELPSLNLSRRVRRRTSALKPEATPTTAGLG